jgi:hypothetical protein
MDWAGVVHVNLTSADDESCENQNVTDAITRPETTTVAPTRRVERRITNQGYVATR